MPYRSGFASGLFDGQIIFIPGGGGGLGRCIAHELASLGARLVLAGRSLEKLERTREEVEADGGTVLSIHSAELRDEAAVVQLVEKAVQHGPIDALVNAAGGQFPAPLDQLSLNGWNAVLANNLTSYFLIAREVFKQSMRETGGAIVNIGADYGRAAPGMGHNGAARSGLASFTFTAASEWAYAGVRVNLVVPGFIATTGLDRYPDSAHDGIRGVVGRIPLGRYGTAAEISAAVVYLISPMAAYTTGAEIRVDGGGHHGSSSFVFQSPPPRNLHAWNGFHRDERPLLLRGDASHPASSEE